MEYKIKMKKFNMLFLFVLLISITVNMFSIYENLNLKKLLEQMLRTKMENDSTMFYLLQKNDKKLITEIIIKDLKLSSKMMKDKFGRELQVTPQLDSLISNQ